MLMGNNLDGIFPYEVSWLLGLEYLHFGTNMIVGNVPEIYHLIHLKYFFLYSNYLAGTIPEVLPPKLKILNYHSNILTGCLPDLHENLIDINLIFNFLTGTIPENIADLKRLIAFDIGNNHITGTIPS